MSEAEKDAMEVAEEIRNYYDEKACSPSWLEESRKAVSDFFADMGKIRSPLQL